MVIASRTLAIVGLLVGIFSALISLGQNKPVIDRNSIKNWPEVSRDALISATGKYVSFNVNSGFIKNIFIKSSKSGREKILDGSIYQPCLFVDDEYFLYRRKDSVFVMSLPEFAVRYLGSFKSAVENSEGGKDEIKFRETSNNGKNSVVYLNLKTRRRRLVPIIEHKSEIVSVKTDHNGINTVCLNDKNGKITKIGDDNQLQIKKRFKIQEASDKVHSGAIQLTLSKIDDDYLPTYKKEFDSTVKLILWSYTKRKPQSSHKINSVERPLNYEAIMLVDNGEIIQIEDDSLGCKELSGIGYLVYDKNNYLNMSPNQFRERIFNYKDLIKYDGKTIKLSNLDSTSNKEFCKILSDRYLIYFNYTKGDYYSYDLYEKITINLTQKLSGFSDVKIKDSYNSRPSDLINVFNPDPISGLSMINETETTRYLVSDGFDIWSLDPSGLIDPICLTKKFGKNNGISFRITWDKDNQTLIKWGKGLIFIGYNPFTKEDGFFEVSLDKPTKPKLIVYDHTMISNAMAPIHPRKANRADVLLYTKSTASKSVNWFWNDGNSEIQLSNVCPEKKYNWITSELIKWETKNGFPLQGILYKPEDFNPNKKYPVIINVYETKSQLLHEFRKPEYIISDIDIPWLVSRGYLVFLPDMKFRDGEAGKSALESLESGADELCKRAYVNTNSIGIAGHSYGGFQSAYFVTHSNRFKAALVSAAITDQVSRYNTPKGLGSETGHQTVEWSQGGLAATLWEKPEQFIENSAIFNLDKVSVPILMMHNDNDNSVPFFQGIEMYLGLHRLGKPAWLIQYEGAGHHLKGSTADTKNDFTIRVTQFFDHYLKDAPAPLWMIEGIDSTEDSYNLGLELDTLGRKPGKSPFISDTEQKLIDAYSKIPLSEKLKRLKD